VYAVEILGSGCKRRCREVARVIKLRQARRWEPDLYRCLTVL
jgi:hypothetical protein